MDIGVLLVVDRDRGEAQRAAFLRLANAESIPSPRSTNRFPSVAPCATRLGSFTPSVCFAGSRSSCGCRDSPPVRPRAHPAECTPPFRTRSSCALPSALNGAAATACSSETAAPGSPFNIVVVVAKGVMHYLIASKVSGIEIRSGAEAVSGIKTLIKGGIEPEQIHTNIGK